MSVFYVPHRQNCLFLSLKTKVSLLSVLYSALLLHKLYSLSPRFEDAAKFIQQCKETFDVVICDSSDPVGPASTLFTPEFYTNLRECLKPGGVLCCQGECMWLHLDLITHVIGVTSKIFPTVEYAYTAIPTYPSGMKYFPPNIYLSQFIRVS